MKVPGWGRWHLPLACSWHVRETGKGLWDLPLQDNEEQMVARVEELSGPHSVRSTAEVLLVFCISKKQEHKPHFYSVCLFVCFLKWWFFVCFVGADFFYLFIFSIHSSSPLGQLIKFAVESKSN